MGLGVGRVEGKPRPSITTAATSRAAISAGSSSLDSLRAAPPSIARCAPAPGKASPSEAKVTSLPGTLIACQPGTSSYTAR